MEQNFSNKNVSSDFIKGTVMEFSEVIKINGVYIKDFRDTIDDFLKDDITLNKVKDAGLTHLFLHIWFYIDEYNGVIESGGVKYYSHLTLKNHNEQNDPEVINDNQWESTLLAKWKKVIDKVCQAGLKPIIKIMNDHYDNNDSRPLYNPDIFFKDYFELTKKILDSDENCNVDIITIANETGYIRNYLHLESYWEKYIDEVRNYRIARGRKIQISMSQFMQDITAGICCIVDFVDIIGFNYYPSVPGADIPTLNSVMMSIYNNDIYEIQEYCRAKNKKFMITEYGCACWEGQCKEPENGNSMAIYYKKPQNYLVQAVYLQGGCIGAQLMDMCMGIDIGGLNKGGTYNWVYKAAKDITKAEDNTLSYNAVKAVWGKHEDLEFDENLNLWISKTEEKI